MTDCRKDFCRCGRHYATSEVFLSVSAMIYPLGNDVNKCFVSYIPKFLNSEHDGYLDLAGFQETPGLGQRKIRYLTSFPTPRLDPTEIPDFFFSYAVYHHVVSGNCEQVDGILCNMVVALSKCLERK